RESLNSCADAERKSRKADEPGCAGNVRDAHAPHNVGPRPLGPLPDNVLVGAVQMELIQSDTLPERRYGRPCHPYLRILSCPANFYEVLVVKAHTKGQTLAWAVFQHDLGSHSIDARLRVEGHDSPITNL